MARARQEWHEVGLRLRAAFDERRCYVPRSDDEARLLRRHALEGEVAEPFPRLFAPAALWDGLRPNERELQIIRGYAQAHPDAVFCSTSAALLHGLPVSFSQLGTIHLYTSASSPTASAARIVRHAEESPSITTVDGIRAASLAQAAVESMRSSPFADGLAVADGLLRRLDIDRELLGEIVNKLGSRRKGVAAARKVAAYADARAESGGESVARGVMICEGLAPTDLQRELFDPVDARRTYYADFVFEPRRLLGCRIDDVDPAAGFRRLDPVGGGAVGCGHEAFDHGAPFRVRNIAFEMKPPGVRPRSRYRMQRRGRARAGEYQ